MMTDEIGEAERFAYWRAAKVAEAELLNPPFKNGARPGSPPGAGIAAEAQREGEMLDRFAAAMREALPRNVCLTNSNIPDTMLVPLDAPIGELRRWAALVMEFDALRAFAPSREPLPLPATPEAPQ